RDGLPFGHERLSQTPDGFEELGAGIPQIEDYFAFLHALIDRAFHRAPPFAMVGPLDELLPVDSRLHNHVINVPSKLGRIARGILPGRDHLLRSLDTRS